MCTTRPSSDIPLPQDRYSVHHESAKEADKHKWIESEKAGYDKGMAAIAEWVHKHWRGYLRERWIEHLLGERFWIELNVDDFGLLRRAFQDSPYLAEILRQLKQEQGENLTILWWAHTNEHVEIKPIMDILHALNINGHRIECRLVQNLQAHCA